MNKRIMSIIIIGYVLSIFTACGTYEPMATKGDVASGKAIDSDVVTGSSVNKEDVKEPAIEEIEEAYHRAIQHDYYRYGKDGRDEEFSGDKMKLYEKTEDDCYTYFLVDKMSDEDGIHYNMNRLSYYTDCEEPGFETEAFELYYLSKDELKEEIKGAEQIGTLDAWKCQPGRKPDYPPMSRVTKNMLQNIEEKVKEEAGKYCIFSEETTCHAYVPQFVPADRSVEILLVTDEEKGKKKTGAKEVYCELHPQISIPSDISYILDRNPYDVWDIPFGESEEGGYEFRFSSYKKELIEQAMTDFTFTIAPCQDLSELGLTDEIQEQITLISRERVIWFPRFIGANTLCYMITDLNQNGRLEIVTTVIASRYEDTTVYEVSEDGKGLVKYKSNYNSEQRQLNIAEETAPEVYYDADTGQYYYRAQVRYARSNGEVSEYEGDFSLQGNVLKQRQFKEYKIYGGIDYDEVKGYYVEDQKVTQDQYEAAVNKHWQGMEKKKAAVGWRESGFHLKNMTEKEIQIRLARSWQEFNIE